MDSMPVADGLKFAIVGSPYEIESYSYYNLRKDRHSHSLERVAGLADCGYMSRWRNHPRPPPWMAPHMDDPVNSTLPDWQGGGL